jgi:transposase
MPKPYSKEFREGALALVRDGRPAAQVARELGIDSCIRNWIKQDQLDRRERDDGLTSVEREELRELRKRVRRLEQEKDILRKAAMISMRQRDAVSRVAAGVWKPSVSLGRVLSLRAISSSCSWVSCEKFVPFGRYWRSRPLVFSLEPRCHGLCGSQK